MKLYLENHNELDKCQNTFDAKQELVTILEQAQDNDLTLSPIEVAGLQLTMRQMDSELALPTTESLRFDPSHQILLATESLKENISAAWKKFMEVLKRIGDAIKKRAKQFADFLRSKRKRKAGEKNEGFEREEAETPETQTETKEDDIKKEAKVVKYHYLMPLAYFEVGETADEHTFLKRIYANIKLAEFGSALNDLYDTRRMAQGAMDAETEEEWTEFLGLTALKVADLMVKTLGAERQGDFLMAHITKHLSITFSMVEPGSWPILIMDDAKGNLVIQGDSNKYVNDLEKVIETTKKGVSKFVVYAVPNFNLIANEKVQSYLMDLMPVYSKRTKFSTTLGRLIETIIGAGEGILADLNAESTDAYM